MSEFRVRRTDDLNDTWTIADGDNWVTTHRYIDRNGNEGNVCYSCSLDEAQAVLDLYLSKQGKEEKQDDKMRQFEGGATRDADDHPEKPSYYKALSPIVLREYVKYLGRHRTQADGSKRDWDNWKAGIPIDVYMDGLLRHTVAVWLIQQGFKSYDNHGEVNLKDSICGVMFNSIGMLHELLKEEIKAEDKAYYDSITDMIDNKKQTKINE